MSGVSNGGTTPVRTDVGAVLQGIQHRMLLDRERLHDAWIWALLGPRVYGRIVDAMDELNDALDDAKDAAISQDDERGGPWR